MCLLLWSNVEDLDLNFMLKMLEESATNIEIQFC